MHAIVTFMDCLFQQGCVSQSTFSNTFVQGKPNKPLSETYPWYTRDVFLHATKESHRCEQQYAGFMIYCLLDGEVHCPLES